MLGNPEPRKDLVVESRIRDFFACGIRILDFDILNTAQSGKPPTVAILNPGSTDKQSGI